MKPRLWFVFAALLSTTPASGQQCTDSTTYRYDTSAVTRPNGNEVDAQGQSQVFGNYQYWWKLYLDSTWSKQNGPTLGHNVGDTNSPGLTVSRLYQTTLQANGPGTYVLSNTHNAWNVYCSYWDNATVTGDQKAILRPARPDYASFYPRALWFLGAGITSDGSYPAQTVFAPGANNGAPESPQYVIANGGNRLSLSCTNCTSPTATAIAGSASCQYFDVQVNTTYNGFWSDPFFLFINRPWNLVAGSDSVGHTWVFSTAKFNGYETHVNYQASGLCSTDPSMSGYHLNENFTGNFTPDYTNENWGVTPTAGNILVPSGSPNWYDNISIYNDGAPPGAPAYCNGPLCNPQFKNPGVGPHTLVRHVLQSWFIGSATSGSGARVQSDTLQNYTDSGWHTSIVTPNP